MSNPVKKERLEVPIWHKPYLTIDEATAYTGIGREKLREMTRFADVQRFHKYICNSQKCCFSILSSGLSTTHINHRV